MGMRAEFMEVGLVRIQPVLGWVDRCDTNASDLGTTFERAQSA